MSLIRFHDDSPDSVVEKIHNKEGITSVIKIVL
jgi:hypothetical protein